MKEATRYEYMTQHNHIQVRSDYFFKQIKSNFFLRCLFSFFKRLWAAKKRVWANLFLN